MPTPEHNRQFRTKPSYLAGDPNGRSNVGARKHRDAETQSVIGFPQNRLFVVCIDQIVNNPDAEARLHQGRRQA